MATQFLFLYYINLLVTMSLFNVLTVLKSQVESCAANESTLLYCKANYNLF